ncbi:hypothetical protein [Pseudobacillus badius]|uniref:hypothetical protein n=1 Tax=Bacillus badius TaxID=1455 RepID=UPI0024A53519|nr:hypothetical protein [Bacillus badius]GLY11347.1 hypothetical protein Bbad01_25630 [Bacillus badius]
MKSAIEAQIKVQKMFIESAQDLIKQEGAVFAFEHEIKIRKQTIRFLESLLDEMQPYMLVDVPHYEMEEI